MPDKIKFVISDLHLGAGLSDQGNYLENFKADTEFVRLLTEIQRESEDSGKEVELILNGDFFEFLQVPAVNHYLPQKSYPESAYCDSSAEASVKRLNLIVQGHNQVFAALRQFIQASDPVRRITLIKGNHDLNLYWPEVKMRLREVLQATGDQSSLLLFAQEFINREHIYVEPGHQRTEQLNAFPQFMNPVNPNNPNQLCYPSGSYFLIHYLNQLKATHWWIDMIKPASVLIWYILKWDFDLAAQILIQLARYTLSSATKDPQTNGNDQPAYLIAQLHNADTRNRLRQQYEADSHFRVSFHAQVQNLLQSARVPQQFYPLQSTDISDDPLRMAWAEEEAAQNALKACAKALVEQEKATIFIFGHTHQAAFEKLPNGGYYINSGCWNWNQYDLKTDTAAWQAFITASLKRQQATPKLSYVRIDYDKLGYPEAQLLDYALVEQPTT